MPIPTVPFNKKRASLSLTREDREVRSLHVDTVMSENLKKGLAALKADGVPTDDRDIPVEAGITPGMPTKKESPDNTVDTEVETKAAPLAPGRRTGPQDGSGPRGDTPACPLTDEDSDEAAGVEPASFGLGGRTGPQDGSGPLGDTPACPLHEDAGENSIAELAQNLVDSITGLESGEGDTSKSLEILESFTDALCSMLGVDSDEEGSIEIEVLDVVDDIDDNTVIVDEPTLDEVVIEIEPSDEGSDAGEGDEDNFDDTDEDIDEDIDDGEFVEGEEVAEAGKVPDGTGPSRRSPRKKRRTPKPQCPLASDETASLEEIEISASNDQGSFLRVFPDLATYKVVDK